MNERTSMVKRIISLKEKQCIVCRNSFQPASGAQMTCSPECKAEAKAKGLNKRGPRGGSDEEHEGETREERIARIDRENPLPSRAGQGRAIFNGQPVEQPGEAQEASQGQAEASRDFPPKRHDIPPGMATAAGKPGKGRKYLQSFQVQVGSANTPANGSVVEEPSLEIDLSPLEEYVRQLVAQEVRKAVAASSANVASKSEAGFAMLADNEILRELIREIVKEEIAERLKGLLA